MIQHAVLSPSGAQRWLSCTPSARLEEKFPDRAGEAAREGTLAHSLGELLIRHKLNLVSQAAYEISLAKIQRDDLYDGSMYDHASDYAAYVLERLEEARSHTKDALLFLEQTLNLTDYIEEGFGTGDGIIIADGVMDIIDLKYGKGVPVSSVENKQMMLYSLGALREFDFMYDIETVRMTIYQPRLDSISTWEMPVRDLKIWADQVLRPLAALAFNGEGPYNPGAHCRFCRAKPVCKAYASMNLDLARYDFQEPVLLDDLEIADILSKSENFINWLRSIEEHALNEAVNNGKKWPGYKLVEGRSNRKYQDETLVGRKLLAAGFAENLIYKKEILGITEMERTIGKKVFSLHLSDLIIKPPGKPTLVVESDKRAEYHSNEAAIKEFTNP